MAAQAQWESFAIQIPGKDLMGDVASILEVLATFLDVLKSILDTVKTFLVDFGNPIQPLVQALLAVIGNLFKTLQQSGFYLYLDVPNPLKDPNFKRQAGGYQGFKGRLKASLVDTKDPNRPQPISGFLSGGFVLLVVDVGGPLQLVTSIQTLLRLFGQETASPRYLAPSNVRALPIGSAGDPLLSVVKVFADPPKAIAVEWSLPSTTPTSGDAGFSGLVSQLGAEFVPPKWIIEKSRIPPVREISSGELADSDSAGIVTTNVDSNFLDPRKQNKPTPKKIRLKDSYGDPFIKMQQYIVVDASTNTATFLLGQLGTFRYIDNDVAADQTYYYRVRAFSGDLSVNGTTINFQLSENMNDGGSRYVQWPAVDPAKPPVVGRASSVLQARLPKLPAFDVLGNLRAVFLTAFSLDFHLPSDPDDQFGSSGLPLNDATPASHIGLGALSAQAGPLASFSSIPILNQLGQSLSLTASSNPITGSVVQLPWQRKSVQAHASRLTIAVSSAMLSAGNSFLEGFRSLMQGALPKGAVTTTWPEPTTTLEQLCAAFTKVDDQGNADDDTAKAFVKAFTDPSVRLNVLSAVQFLQTFTFGGASTNWIQVSLLRDIVPWEGQFIYDLLAKIQALQDAYSGVTAEIKAFIDLIERKIDTLERFLKFLTSILDFLESMQLNFALLNVPSIEGDISNWISTIEGAQNAPTSGPKGYTGGIMLAYLAPDITALSAALGLLF